MRAKNCYPVVRFSGTPYRLVPSQKSMVACNVLNVLYDTVLCAIFCPLMAFDCQEMKGLLT